MRNFPTLVPTEPDIADGAGGLEAQLPRNP
jgi:hypothetical protein